MSDPTEPPESPAAEEPATAESSRVAEASGAAEVEPSASGRGGGHTGRRPGSAGTRGQILDAARIAFGEKGFDGATIRDIAARAGVDPALVHHFYGSKQQLFMAAMQFPLDLSRLVPRVLDGPPEKIGERLASTILGVWESAETQPLIMGMIRSATTDPVAAEMLRELLTQGPLQAMVQAIDRPDAPLRASLVGSQIVGLMMVRYVVGVEPLASADRETVVRTVGAAIQHYLFEDLGAD